MSLEPIVATREAGNVIGDGALDRLLIQIGTKSWVGSSFLVDQKVALF